MRFTGGCILIKWLLRVDLLQVPPRAEEITIPADVTPEKVPTHIVDYSGNLTCIMQPPNKSLPAVCWSHGWCMWHKSKIYWHLSLTPTEKEQSDEILRDEIIKVSVSHDTRRNTLHTILNSWNLFVNATRNQNQTMHEGLDWGQTVFSNTVPHLVGNNHRKVYECRLSLIHTG